MRQLIALMIVFASLASCSSTGLRETKYDGATGKLIVKDYSGYFDSRSMLVPDRVGIDLVVDVEKRTIPGVHQLAQSVGALGPGDTEAKGLFTAYVHNLTASPQSMTISSMQHEGQAIVATPVTISLPADTYQKVVLGTVTIFSYATELKVNMSYAVGTETFTKVLTPKRQTQEEIAASVAKWKGKKKNVPEFFTE